MTDLDFTDHISLLSDSDDSLQGVTTELHNQATRLDLDIRCEKTKAMLLASEQSPPVTTGQQSIEYVDYFPYVGSYLSDR